MKNKILNLATVFILVFAVLFSICTVDVRADYVLKTQRVTVPLEYVYKSNICETDSDGSFSASGTITKTVSLDGIDFSQFDFSQGVTLKISGACLLKSTSSSSFTLSNYTYTCDFDCDGVIKSFCNVASGSLVGDTYTISFNLNEVPSNLSYAISFDVGGTSSFVNTTIPCKVGFNSGAYTLTVTGYVYEEPVVETETETETNEGDSGNGSDSGNSSDSEVGSNISFDSVLVVASNLVSWSGELLEVIVDNPILVVFLSASFVGVGLGIVRKLKKTSGG